MKDVIFRRIHGHIVPIKLSEKQKEQAKGVAIASGGLGVAAASGAVASRFVMNAAHAENEARAALRVARKARKATEALGPLFKPAADKAYSAAGMSALRTMVESRKLFTASLNLRNAGFLAGSALVGAGVHKALSAGGDKQDKKTNLALASGVAVATHFAIRSSFLKGLQHKTFAALRMAAKAIILDRYGG